MPCLHGDINKVSKEQPSSIGLLWLAFRINLREFLRWTVRGPKLVQTMDKRWMKENLYNSGKNA